MENERFKYIAALEISSDEIHFGVSRFSLIEKSFIVVHKDRMIGNFVENENLKHKEEIIDFLNKNFIEFESIFKAKLSEILLIIPDNQSTTRKNYETLKFANPKNISPLDIKELKKYTSNKLSGDYEMVIKADCLNTYIDNVIISNRYFNKIGREISSDMIITFVNKKFINDCNEVISECGKKIKKIKTYSMTLGTMIAKNDDKANVIINWANRKTVVSVYSNGIVYAVKEITIGLDDMLDKAMKAMPGIKRETLKQYIFNMLNFDMNNNDLNDVVFRKFIKGEKNEYTKEDFKQIILKSINYIVLKTDEIISMTFKDNLNLKIFHLGKILKLAGFESVLKIMSHYRNFINFQKFDTIGASENWALVMNSIMVFEAEKEYFKKQEQLRKKQLMNNSILKQKNNNGIVYNSPQNAYPQHNQQIQRPNLNNNYNNYQTNHKNYIK